MRLYRNSLLAVCAGAFLALSACASSAPAPASAARPVQQPAVSQAGNAAAPLAADSGTEHLRRAIMAEARPQADRERDADRKPLEILQFFGVKPGMKIADLITGHGYYAEILARAVGPEGKVYAHNNQMVIERYVGKAVEERTKHPELASLVPLVSELDNLGLPPGELDMALMFLFYHDTYWMGLDRAKINRAVFDALKPGGIYGVVDHHAESGSRDRDVNTLHRVDAEMVKQEILAAGFVLDGESDILAHPEDSRTTNVFDKGIRGKTAQFIFRFRKPAP